MAPLPSVSNTEILLSPTNGDVVTIKTRDLAGSNEPGISSTEKIADDGEGEIIVDCSRTGIVPLIMEIEMLFVEER